MDTLYHHQAVAAVEESLAAGGYEGFVLSPAMGRNMWFNVDWMYDYVQGLPHRELEIRWRGQRFPNYDCLEVTREGWSRPMARLDRHGIVVVRGEAVIASFHVVNDLGTGRTHLIVGEKRAGALQEFLDGYSAYAQRRTREDLRIYLPGGESEDRPSGATWDDLVLPGDLLQDIRAQVTSFFQSRELYRRMGIPYRRGCLLVGPPGNGKTSVLRVIAAQTTEPFVLFRMKSDSDEGDLADAFQFAQFNAPSILCFEDVDSLFKEIALSSFLNHLDGLSSVEGVLVLATTNHPEELDGALTNRPSRFDRVWVFPNPEARERREYLQRQFREVFDERLVPWTDGLSFAHLKEVWVSACLEAIQSGGAPTTDSAKRAVERVQGHRVAVEKGFEAQTRPVGFRRAGSG